MFSTSRREISRKIMANYFGNFQIQVLIGPKQINFELMCSSIGKYTRKHALSQTLGSW